MAHGITIEDLRLTPTWAQLRDAHDHFAGVAASIVNSGDEVQPQLFLLSYDDPGAASVDAVPQELVVRFFRNQEGKEQLAAFVKAVLTEGSPLRARLAEELGRAPDVLLQLTEAWALERPTQEDAERLQKGLGSVSEHPNRVEVLAVLLHTSTGTISTMHRIDAGPPRRCNLEPFPREDKLAVTLGRMAMPSVPPKGTSVH